MSSDQSSILKEQSAPGEFKYPSVSAGDAGANAKPDEDVRHWTERAGMKEKSSQVGIEQKEQQARARGVEEGRTAARAEFEKNAAALRQQIGTALRDFAAERDTYFHRVEEQVVRLSLAIVRKILHRESQVDPLLLTGVLRVAMEKVASTTTTRLRANPADIKVWREYFAQDHEKYPAPELIGDPELEPSRCILETDLGTTEIGLETQLKEIEKGFLDLLAQRPGQQ